MNDENLIPAKAGEIRNKKGRGKGTKNFKTIYKKYLSLVMKPDATGFDIPFVDKGKELPLQEMIVLRHIKKMIGKADARDIGMIMDRVDGLLKQNIDIDAKVNLFQNTINKFFENKDD